MNTINSNLENLFVLFQKDLELCGNILFLLEEQVDLIVRNKVDEIWKSMNDLQEALSFKEAEDQKRLVARESLVNSLGLEIDSSWEKIVSRIPCEKISKLNALVKESESVLAHCRKRMSHNLTLLSCIYENLQDIIGLFPLAVNQVSYGKSGALKPESLFTADSSIGKV